MHEACIGRINTLARIVAPEEVRIPLRPDEAHTRHRRALDEIAFVRVPPPHHGLRRAEHELEHARSRPTKNEIGHPGAMAQACSWECQPESELPGAT